jgi:predicted site-specific integrase-resolvase
VNTYLSRKQVSDALGVSISSVDNYIRRGWIVVTRLAGKGGRVVIKKSDFESFLREREFRGAQPANDSECTAATPAPA